jgi:hypothetical protein
MWLFFVGNLNKRQALSANARTWLRGDRENCCVFFRGNMSINLPRSGMSTATPKRSIGNAE